MRDLGKSDEILSGSSDRPDRPERSRPMGRRLAAQFPELGKVWTRLFGQALIHWMATRVERK